MTDYPVEIPEIVPGSRTDLFPYGQRRDRKEVVIACLNQDHLKRVINAMPIAGAMYIVVGAHLAGRRFTKAVIFTEIGTYSEHERVRLWIQSNIWTRMLPDHEHEVHII